MMMTVTITKVIPPTTWSWLVFLTWVPQQRLASTPGIVTSRTWLLFDDNDDDDDDDNDSDDYDDGL